MSLGGRPRIYETEEALQEAVTGYFEYIKGEKQSMVADGGLVQEIWVRNPEPATITGLALFLGFESRQSIYDYAKDGRFSYIVKSAQLRVECEYEKKLSGNTPTGSIFALKNMGWKDKTESDVNMTGGVQIVFEKSPNCDPIIDAPKPD